MPRIWKLFIAVVVGSGAVFALAAGLADFAATAGDGERATPLPMETRSDAERRPAASSTR